MSTIENPTPTTAAPQLPDTLRLGPVHLTVANLGGSIAFYERSLGLQVHGRESRSFRRRGLALHLTEC